jgi:hypothetical protein
VEAVRVAEQLQTPVVLLLNQPTVALVLTEQRPQLNLPVQVAVVLVVQVLLTLDQTEAMAVLGV